MLVNAVSCPKYTNDYSLFRNNKTNYESFESKNINLNYLPSTVSNISFRSASTTTSLTKQARAKGCLFGGAIGDAMGRLAEFRNLDAIRFKYGENGVQYIPKVHGQYLITDDTQMTLFTADGLLKSYLKTANIEEEPNYDVIYNSYLNWYETQTTDYYSMDNRRGLLANEKLFSRRGPGYTCLSALNSAIPGSLENKINSSAGNGGIMRSSPIALMYNNNPELAFKVGVKCAALTHGSPEAYLPAGFFCALLANIFNENNIDDAISNSILILKSYKEHEKTLKTIEKAIALAESDVRPNDAISRIGKGKIGDEALAIAIYCVLKNPNDYKKIITMAVNHDGDSDTTAAIAGNLAGALYGVSAIPKQWTENIECSEWLSFYADKLIIDYHQCETLKQAIINEDIDERRATDRFSPIDV